MRRVCGARLLSYARQPAGEASTISQKRQAQSVKRGKHNQFGSADWSLLELHLRRGFENKKAVSCVDYRSCSIVQDDEDNQRSDVPQPHVT